MSRGLCAECGETSRTGARGLGRDPKRPRTEVVAVERTFPELELLAATGVGTNAHEGLG